MKTLEHTAVLVTGTREPISDEDKATLIFAISKYTPDIIIVGDAKGVDAFVREYYADIIEVRVFYADWETYGRPAGHMRNQEMVEAIGPFPRKYFVAMPGPGSKGTWDCVKRAAAAGIRGEIIPRKDRGK